MYRLKYVLRRANTHKIARLVLGHIRLDRADYPIHLLCALADGKSAYCIAVAVKRSYFLHVIYAQIFICTALIYTKKHLVRVYGVRQRIQPCHFLFAAAQPAVCSLAGSLRIVVLRGIFYALVKRHCDSGAEV